MTEIAVGDVYDPRRRGSVVVGGDDPLESVLAEFADHPSLRGIFVTDEAGALLGVIARTDLLHWAHLRLGTALRGPSLTPDRILRMAEMVRAAHAKDAVHPGSDRAAVTPQDRLSDALGIMFELDLVAVPVVDESGRVVGDLTLSHALRHLLRRGSDAPDG